MIRKLRSFTILATVAANCLGVRSALAQEPEEPTRLRAGIGILGSAPTGEFGRNIESAGGISGHIDYGLGDSVWSVGGEAAYLLYGAENRKIPLSPTLPDVLLNVNTDNSMFLLHGRLRAQRQEGRWRPYVDGLFGFTDIFTTTSVDGDCGPLTDCGSLSSTNLSDFVLSYGGGAGVMVGFGDTPNAPSSPRLDISVRYLLGGEANYLRQGAIHRENGSVSLDISRSRTDTFLVYIGVAFGR